MIILGIDPGLATVGIGIIDASIRAAVSPRVAPSRSEERIEGRAALLSMTPYRAIDYCTIETSKASTTAERLKEIAEDLSAIIQKHRPLVAVIEKLYFETNQKTAMSVAEARGAILLTCAQAGLTIIEPTPLQLKVAVTGDGRADKKQMQDMVGRTLKIDLTGVSDDAADALGLCIFGVASLSRIQKEKV